ncbi:hypothetical protein BDR22DRAFT_860524 [Usnea florida]
MGRDRNENKRLEEEIKEKDAEIERLKAAQQAHITRIKELEAKLASLEYSSTPTDSDETIPPMPIFKFPELPLFLRKKPTSVFANLPAPPVFSGFDTSDEGAALRTPVSNPEASSVAFPPRSSALFPSTKSTLGSAMPPNLETRPKGAVPRHPPHHQSSSAVPGALPSATASTLSRDLSEPSASLRDSSKETPITGRSPAKR